jgi:hypothetical protein
MYSEILVLFIVLESFHILGKARSLLLAGYFVIFLVSGEIIPMWKKPRKAILQCKQHCYLYCVQLNRTWGIPEERNSKCMQLTH